jgi:hypothetical protein
MILLTSPKNNVIRTFSADYGRPIDCVALRLIREWEWSHMDVLETLTDGTVLRRRIFPVAQRLVPA